MMCDSELLKYFWGYLFETSVYLLNRVPSKSVQATSYEMWFSKKAIISYLRIWDCRAYVKHIESDKLNAKYDKCLFVG